MSMVGFSITPGKLQHIYDLHAHDFDLEGNKNPQQLQKLRNAIESHLNDAETKLLIGQYRGREAHLYYNERTQNVIVTDESVNVLAGFKASPAQA